MANNPKYKITNFTKDNIYWLKEMLLVNTGGYNAITGGYYSAVSLDKDDEGYASLADIDGSIAATDLQIGSTTSRTLIVSDGSEIYSNGTITIPNGKIHTLIDGGSPTYLSTRMDILTTPRNNLLYTTAGHLGVGYYFVATSGSGATTINCTTVNFTTLGVATTAGHNKVYDITLGQEFNITTKADTALTVDAVAGKVPASGDICMVFVDDKFDLENTTGVPYPQFVGQETDANWVRQMKRLDDRTFILNGNYLAMLSADDATLTDDYQQFPLGVQGTCMSVNNDLILIGAKNKGNTGMLMIYDGFSTYFKSIINTTSIPASIVPYQTGWIVVFKNGEIRYTDGIAYKTMTKFPDTETRTNDMGILHNNALLFENKLFITAKMSSVLSLRMQYGLHVYDIDNDVWSFTALKSYYGYSENINICIYPIDTFGSGQTLYYGGDGIIGRIGVGSTDIDKDIFLTIKLPKKDKISNIELNLGQQYNSDYNNDTDDAATVTVSSWDGRYGLFTYNQAKATSTTTSILPNVVGRDVFVGQELFVLGNDATDTKNDHEYTYITEVANKGESNETWTISPALTADIGASIQNLKLFGYKLCETKTINFSTLNKDSVFNVKDFYGDKLYLHIRIKGYLDLLGINIY